MDTPQEFWNKRKTSVIKTGLGIAIVAAAYYAGKSAGAAEILSSGKVVVNIPVEHLMNAVKNTQY